MQLKIAATLQSAVLSTGGLTMAYGPDLRAGPTIILLVGAVYLLSTMITLILYSRRARLAVAPDLWTGEIHD